MSMSIGLGLGIGKRRGRAPLLAETAALITRMSVKPTDARAALIDKLIRSLKTAGIWSKLDGLYLLAAHDAQAARLNWIGSSYNLSAVSSPTFVADRYYVGDGSTSYLDTGFNPSTAPAAKYVLNSAHLSVWSVTEDATSTYFDLGSTTARINPRGAGNTLRGMLNDTTLVSYGALGTSLGHFALNRSASGALQAWRNGTQAGTAATASVALDNSTVRLLGNIAGGYSARRLVAASLGGSLSSGDVQALYAAINAYLTAIGAA